MSSSASFSVERQYSIDLSGKSPLCRERLKDSSLAVMANSPSTTNAAAASSPIQIGYSRSSTFGQCERRKDFAPARPPIPSMRMSENTNHRDSLHMKVCSHSCFHQELMDFRRR